MGRTPTQHTMLMMHGATQAMFMRVPAHHVQSGSLPIKMSVEASPRAATWKPGETAPAYLDGSLPADAGCDPLCLAALVTPVGVEEQFTATGSFLDKVVPFPWSLERRKEIMAARSADEQRLTVEWMREAEVKHARLAMLAAVGWPLAELFAGSFGALSATEGRAPSLFNGHLGDFAPFLVLAAGLAAFLELQTIDNVNQTWLSTPSKKIAAGDLGFDPLEVATRVSEFRPISQIRAAEIYNGRLAMLAITGFSVQEFLWHTPVIDQVPIFFGR